MRSFLTALGTFDVPFTKQRQEDLQALFRSSGLMQMDWNRMFNTDFCTLSWPQEEKLWAGFSGFENKSWEDCGVFHKDGKLVPSSNKTG